MKLMQARFSRILTLKAEWLFHIGIAVRILAQSEYLLNMQKLNAILHKVTETADFISLSNIVVTRTAYRLTDKMHEDHPEAIGQLSKGHAYDMATNIFDRLPQIFFDAKPTDENDYIRILGRTNNERAYKYVRRDYVNKVKKALINSSCLFQKANGIGAFGEVISSPITANTRSWFN